VAIGGFGKKVIRGFGFSLAALTLFLLVAEGVIRLTGLALLAPSDLRNSVKPEDGSKLRILALGESTTADFFAANTLSWPRLLEEKLRNQGVNARVYNKGISGTNTSLIASRLPEYLEEFRPHIVVSMMGVNDGGDIVFGGYESSRLALWVSQIRLWKMMKWAWQRVERFGECEIDYTELDPDRQAFPLKRAYALASSGSSLAAVEAEVRRLLRPDDTKTVALIFAVVSGMLSQGDLQPDADLSQARLYAEKAFELYPFNNRIASSMLAASSGDARIAAGLKLIRCGRSLPDNLLAQLSAVPPFSADLASWPVFRERNLTAEGARYSTPTSKNYREMHQFLRRNGVALVAMQYPTLPVGDLKALFLNAEGKSETSDIVFVSNEENFERLLRTHPYEQVFFDRFRGSWGHTTPLGHHAIADSVLPAVMGVVRVRADLKRALSASAAE
jgi:hypothetical protein